MGISRSATLVLAFLMIYENKNLVEALKMVREHRGVCPNTGFLSQLRDLDLRLISEKGKARGEFKPYPASAQIVQGRIQ
ncbi:Dual specificity protein phosphatase 13, partial [Ophiophagus hannah]